MSVIVHANALSVDPETIATAPSRFFFGNPLSYRNRMTLERNKRDSNWSITFLTDEVDWAISILFIISVQRNGLLGEWFYCYSQCRNVFKGSFPVSLFILE